MIERIYDKDVDEIEQYLIEYGENIKNGVYPKHHKIYDLSRFKYREKFIEDIESELQLFDEILSRLKKLKMVDNDPKRECLIKNIKASL